MLQVSLSERSGNSATAEANRGCRAEERSIRSLFELDRQPLPAGERIVCVTIKSDR